MRLWRLLSTLRLRLRSVVRRARVEQDLDDEIRDHIDRRVAADVARGAPPSRRARQRSAPSAASSRRRSVPGRAPCECDRTYGPGLRFAARRFARAPVVTATMIGIFALGIGFSAALFLLVQSFVSGPVPGSRGRIRSSGSAASIAPGRVA